jgi:hypothetical protein
VRAATRKSFHRAYTAIALAAVNRSKYPSELLKQHWHGDEAAERVLKAVSTPSVILPALAPASTASKLMRPTRRSRRCRKRFGFSHDLTTFVRFNTHDLRPVGIVIVAGGACLYIAVCNMSS